MAADDHAAAPDQEGTGHPKAEFVADIGGSPRDIDQEKVQHDVQGLLRNGHRRAPSSTI